MLGQLRPARLDSRKARRTRLQPGPGIILVSSLVLSVLYFNKATWLQDEGMLLTAVKRITSGEMIYRDFFEFWTPLAPYLAAGLVSLLRNLGSLRTALFWGPRAIFALNIFLVSLFTYSFSQKLIRNPWLQLLPSLIFLVSIASSQIGFNHNWLALNLTVLTVWLSFRSFRWKWGTLGFLSGLTVLTIQTQGLALVLWCLWLLRRTFKPVGFILPLARYFLGLISIVTSALFYFAYHQALADFLYAAVIFPLTGYRQVNWAAVPNKLLFGLLVFYLGYSLYLKNRPRLAGRLQKDFLLLSIIFTLPALFTPGPAHTAYVFPFVLPLLISVSERFSSGLRPHSNLCNDSVIARGIVLFGILLVTADFGTRLAPNFYHLLTRANAPLETSAGVLYTWDWQAEIASDINQFIAQNTRPGEYVLAAPYSPIFYVMGEIRNPTRYSQLTPNYNPKWMFEQAIVGLEQKKPRYIIFYPSENPFKFDEKNLLSQYVLKHYQLVRKYPPTYRPENKPTDGVYERKN